MPEKIFYYFNFFEYFIYFIIFYQVSIKAGKNGWETGTIGWEAGDEGKSGWDISAGSLLDPKTADLGCNSIDIGTK